MAHPNEIQLSLEAFRNDHPNSDRTAFLIMRFSNKKIYNQIVAELKSVFDNNRIALLRADDKEYHHDLFLNLQTYMHGCGIGVAVLDRIQEEDFNPNVSFEIGYMMSLFKPVLLLKDETIKTLNVDLMGKLYRTFDPHDLENTITLNSQKWLKDKGLCYSCFEFNVTIDQKINEIVANKETLDTLISDISIHSPNKQPLVKGLQTSLDGQYTTIVFEGDIDCYEHLKKLLISKRLKTSSEINILDIASQVKDINWGNDGLVPVSNKNVGQICRLSGIQGHFTALEESKRIIGNRVVHSINDCSVCAILDENYILFVSNLLNHRCLHPTKFLVPLWLEENKIINLFDAFNLIAAAPGLLIYPSKDEVTVAHFHKVSYYIDKRLIQENNPYKFNLDGARNIYLF